MSCSRSNMRRRPWRLSTMVRRASLPSFRIAWIATARQVRRPGRMPPKMPSLMTLAQVIWPVALDGRTMGSIGSAVPVPIWLRHRCISWAMTGRSSRRSWTRLNSTMRALQMPWRVCSRRKARPLRWTKALPGTFRMATCITACERRRSGRKLRLSAEPM